MERYANAASLIIIGTCTTGILAQEVPLIEKSGEHKREEAQARVEAHSELQDGFRKEIAASEKVLIKGILADQSKWKLTDHYPPEGLVPKAYDLLKGAGHEDLMEEGGGSLLLRWRRVARLDHHKQGIQS